MTAPPTPQRSFGLGRADFRPVARNGFGDPYNCYPHAMTWFDGRLFVGTTRANLQYRGRWRLEQGGEDLGAAWPVPIPTGGLFDIDLRAQIWCYTPETHQWRKVYTAALVTGRDGFQVPRSIGFRSIVVFQGKNDRKPALYVPTWGSHQTPEAVMLRSEDGEDFQVVSVPGLGFPSPYEPRAIRALVPFKGRLFAAPAAGRKRAEPNFSGYTVMLATDDPAGGAWHLACEPGFGDPTNLTIFEAVEFNGFLYAGTGNPRHGFQLWKTDGEGPPPYRWQRVLDGGALRGKFNQATVSMAVFGDHLYIGTGIQEGGWDRANNIGPAPPELLRLDREDRWELVAGEPRAGNDGPVTPLSGHGAGFANPFCGYFWSLCVHDGHLYLGTSDWSIFLRYARQDRIPEELRPLFAEQTVESYIRRYAGFDLWRSSDGRHWQPVTTNGFGNPYNMGVRNMVSTPHGLFVGVANPFAPEVAVRGHDGFRYQPNPDGGLEIWLGRRWPAHTPGKAPVVVRAGGVGGGPGEEELVARFFDHSQWRSWGWWRHQAPAPAPAVAAAQLAREALALMAPAEDAHLLVVDGCPELARICRQAHRGPLTVRLAAGLVVPPGDGDIAYLKHSRRLPQGVGAILWLRVLDDTPPPGGRELRRLVGHLSPGGTLVLFDWLEEEGRRRGWLGGRNRRPADRDAYQRLLQDAGLDVETMEEVTEFTVAPMRRQAATFCDRLRLAGTAEATVARLAQHLCRPQTRCALLVRGRRREER